MKPLTRENILRRCPRCEADPGKNCLTKGRRQLRLVHDPRDQPNAPARLDCPSCGRLFRRQALGGHRTHCGVENPPGTIWRRPRPRGLPGVIYLIETTEGPPRVKIGISADAQRRFQALRMSAPVTMRLRAFWPDCEPGIEWDLHQMVRPLWVHGEWFDATAAEQVERHMAGRPRHSTLAGFKDNILTRPAANG